MKVAVCYSAPSIIFLTSKWKVSLMRVSLVSHENLTEEQAVIRTMFDAVASLKYMEQTCCKADRHQCSTVFRYVHPAVCLLMSFSHLDPVSGSRHCFSSISHSAPWGLLLAMCVSGGAHSACGPGHSLQYVGFLRRQTVCAGVCPMWLHVSGLAVWSACQSNKRRKREIFLKKERKKERRYTWVTQEKFYLCGVSYLICFFTYSSLKFFLLLPSHFLSKPARIQGLCPWLPLPPACRTWTCASSKLWCYSR